MNLDLIERRGRLIYSVGIQVRSMEGHFRLTPDGRTIEARKVKGRYRWSLCPLEAASHFIERREWEK